MIRFLALDFGSQVIGLVLELIVGSIHIYKFLITPFIMKFMIITSSQHEAGETTSSQHEVQATSSSSS